MLVWSERGAQEYPRVGARDDHGVPRTTFRREECPWLLASPSPTQSLTPIPLSNKSPPLGNWVSGNTLFTQASCVAMVLNVFPPSPRILCSP